MNTDATQQLMRKEILESIESGETFDDIRDRAGELIDSYTPLYNNQVIEEWQHMPSEYDNKGAAELGHNCKEIDIINLMQADLYLFYSDLFNEVLDELEEEANDAA